MRRLIIYSSLILLIVSACKREDEPILENPDVRLQAELDKNQSALVDAPYGWKAQIYPEGGKGFTFYFKFKKNGKVEMLSDFNNTTGSTAKESTYRIKALQRPTLIFDTYSYIHLLADPDGSINGGGTGQGLISDFEFAFEELQDFSDSVKLKGVYNGNQMVLAKVTKEEQEAFLNGALKISLETYADYATKNRYPFVSFDNEAKVSIVVDASSKSATLNYVDTQGILQSHSSKFAFTTAGFVLEDPFIYKGKVYKEAFYDSDLEIYYFKDGDTIINFQNSSFPLIDMDQLFGYGKAYTAMYYDVDGGLPAGVMSDFNTTYNSAAALFVASNRSIDYAWLSFVDQNNLIFSIWYNSGSSRFLATITFKVSYESNGSFSLSTPVRNGNWGTRAIQVKPFEDYFLASGRKFKFDWVANPVQGSSALLGGMHVVGATNNFYYGVVE